MFSYLGINIFQPNLTNSSSMLLEEISDGRYSQTASYFLCTLQTSLRLGKDPEGLSDTLACQDFLCLLPMLHHTE